MAPRVARERSSITSPSNKAPCLTRRVTVTALLRRNEVQYAPGRAGTGRHPGQLPRTEVVFPAWGKRFGIDAGAVERAFALGWRCDAVSQRVKEKPRGRTRGIPCHTMPCITLHDGSCRPPRRGDVDHIRWQQCALRVSEGTFSRRLQLGPGLEPPSSRSLSPASTPNIYGRAGSLKSPVLDGDLREDRKIYGRSSSFSASVSLSSARRRSTLRRCSCALSDSRSARSWTSSGLRYRDDTQSNVAAFTGIPARVSLR
jgi:hypothetical protein